MGFPVGGMREPSGRIASADSARGWLVSFKAPPWDGQGTGHTTAPWKPSALVPGPRGCVRQPVTSCARWQSEPRLRSRLTAQLVARGSCQPDASRLGRLPAQPWAPWRCARRAASSEQSLPCAARTERGGSAVEIGFLEEQERSSPPPPPPPKEGAGRRRLWLLALEVREQGFSFSQAAATPG